MQMFRFGQRVRHRRLGTGTVIAFENVDIRIDNGTAPIIDYAYLENTLLGVNNDHFGNRIYLLLDDPSIKVKCEDYQGSPCCVRKNITPLDEPDFVN